MSTPIILLVPKSCQVTFFSPNVFSFNTNTDAFRRLICRHNDTSAMGITLIPAASSLLIGDDSYYLQSCVEVWYFLRLYGYSAPCDKSKWYLSIFNHANLIRAECDKCIQAPKWLLRFELWQEQSRWLLCSRTDGILSFFTSSPETTACWILSLAQWEKPHWGFWSNFSSPKIIVALFVLLLYLKSEQMKQKCFLPSKSLALFLILIQFTLLLPLSKKGQSHDSPVSCLFVLDMTLTSLFWCPSALI